MINIETRLKDILNRVNNQINSHTIVVQRRHTFDVLDRVKDHIETKRAIKELSKSYPNEKYGRK